MYKYNPTTGTISLNGVIIPLDDNSPLFADYLVWLEAGGSLTDTDDLCEEEVLATMLTHEFEKYQQRKEDGINAYLLLSAELRLAKIGGVISNEAHRAIETALEPIRAEVVLGQWIGAKEKLEELGDYIIGEQMYQKLYNIITNYISTHY